MESESVINADWFFAIGKTHNVCEDYAYAEGGPEAAVAVLSDGCSGSPDTDFGSRLLVRATAERLWDDGTEFDALKAIYQASGMAKQIGLQEFSLDATIICAKSIKQPSGIFCNVWAQGDGVIAVRKKDGSYIITEIYYDSGMPAYLSYLLNKSRKERYEKETQSKEVFQESASYDSDWNLQNRVVCPGKIFQLQEPLFTYGPDDDIDLIALISDGVKSFQKKHSETRILEAVPHIEVLQQVLALKGRKGEFLKRRCGNFLTKFCVQHGWQHGDDFSAVAIDLSENESSS
jgi:hypothetical protein